MSGWRPSSPAATARRRAALLGRARQYFEAEGVLEVDTPALSSAASSDPNIESLRVRAAAGDEAFLHTSPESCMKRLLAAGYPDIFSISRVFRDAESGAEHLPEFTLLEWYRNGFGLAEIIADAARLVAACLDDPALVDGRSTWDYADALREFAGINALVADTDELAARVDADRDLRAAIGDDRDAWLDLVFATVVLPRLPTDRLTVLQHYPASMAALARLCPADARVADRFEVFLGRRELANGYVELTDAGEQRERFEREILVRRQQGRASGPIDAALLEALEAGLPPCAGVAVGVERLHMTLDKTDNIADVVTFVTGTADG